MASKMDIEFIARMGQSHIRFLKMEYAILQKRISHLVEWHMRFFANVRI